MYTSLIQEPQLVLGTINFNMPTVPIPGFVNTLDSRQYTNSKQQLRNVIG